MQGQALVIVPTYNERENLAKLILRLRTLPDDIHVLIVDDNSPDGTGAIAAEMAAADAGVHLLSRAGKQGLGTAYRAGFRYGLAHDFAYLCTMDADFSHSPESLPALLEAAGFPESGQWDFGKLAALDQAELTQSFTLRNSGGTVAELLVAPLPKVFRMDVAGMKEGALALAPGAEALWPALQTALGPRVRDVLHVPAEELLPPAGDWLDAPFPDRGHRAGPRALTGAAR